MKVGLLSELTEHARDRRDRRRLAAYMRGDRSDDTLAGIHDMFVNRWLCSQVPESISGPPAELRTVGRDTGIAVLLDLVAQGSGGVHGVRPVFVGPNEARALTPDEQAHVPLAYDDLATWFTELFDPADATWAIAHGSAVWASDAQLAAICWRE